MTYDLIVIGAGPGGCAAAITAARAGARVLLLERGQYPRHRVCGEFVSAEALGLLEDMVSPGNRGLITGALKISQSRVFSDGQMLPLPIDPPASSIPRFDLDRALWASCMDLGIDARDGTPARSAQRDQLFTVMAQGELFQGRALVNAAGRWSFLTSQNIRSSVAVKKWVGLKAHFLESEPSPTVDLYFFEGGYCGVQPVALPGREQTPGVVNACAMVRTEVATQLNDVFELHPHLRERSKHWRKAMEPVSTSPLVFHKPEPVQGLTLQVGDSATFVDPFIGDGISLALRSGVLASRCIHAFLNGSLSLPEAVRQYQFEYMRRLAPVFRSSTVLRTLLRVPRLIRGPAMSALKYTPAITNQIVRMTR